MAKKSRQQRKAKAAQAPLEPSVNTAAAPTPAPPSERASAAKAPGNEPHFWFGFAVSWPKLITFRFTLLMVLAVDAVLQISHAPRYGAGGFNVGHVRWLSGLAPARTLFEIVQLVTALCLVAAAVGAATRIMLPIAAALYAWIYFSSQLDSYQHHYLVALMLFLLCFVDWQRPVDRRSANVVGGWPLRLLLVQLAIMYFWAAISKADGAWLDGSTLSLQIHGSMRSAMEHTVGFGFAAKMVLLVEFALAATIWYRPGWWVALPMGIALHAGIVWSGLEIGLFAWLMLVLYLLLVPDRVFTWAATKLQPLQRVAAQVATPSARRWAFMIVGIGLGFGIAASTRYPHALLAAAIGAGLVTIANLIDGQRRKQTAVFAFLAPALAAVVWLGVDRTTTTMYDYYRFWAGSESRIGDPARAKALYREVTERFPNEENGYYQLAKLEIASGSTDDKQQAAAHLQRAQQLAPKLARAFVAEAKLLLSQGDRDAALAKAQAGAAAEPTSVDALTLVRQLQAMAPGAPAVPGAAAPTMPGKRPILDTDDDR